MVRVTSWRPSDERETLVAAVDRHAGHFERCEGLGAEPLRLHQRAAGQLAAADAGREPEVVLDPRTAAGLAARGVPIEHQRAKALRCAVHRGREAGGTGADDYQVVHVKGRRQRSTETLGDAARVRIAQHGSVFEKQNRQLVDADTGGLDQRPRIRIPLDVEPPIRNQTAGQEILDRVRSRRPLVSDESQPFGLGQVFGLPRVEKIVDHREQTFLRRIPRLRQIVIEVRFVDRLDRGLDIRIGREQHAPGQRVELARGGEQLVSQHAGHALIADHHRERVAAALQLADGVERLLSGAGAQHGVLLPIPAAEVAAHGRQHLRIVVDDEDDGLVHGWALRRVDPTAGSATRNSVRPGCDSTEMSPSLWRTRRRTMSRPRPVPWPSGLVVKNGSKMRSRIFSGMPLPLSMIRTTTSLAFTTGPHLDAA